MIVDLPTVVYRPQRSKWVCRIKTSVINIILKFDQHGAFDCKALHYNYHAHINPFVTYVTRCLKRGQKRGLYSHIGSKLDYCTALLVGMLESNFFKFPRVQNTLSCSNSVNLTASRQH